MIRYPAAEPFPTAWQRELEAGLETGQPPRLDLGFNQGMLPSIRRVVSLQAFVDQRTDTTTTQILCGGDSSIWLVLLLMRQADHAAQPATVLYTGTEPVTHVASVATQQATTHVADAQAANAVPVRFATLLAPTFASGVTHWEALPFVGRAPASQFAEPSNAPQADSWLAWAAISTALLMLFIPLLTLFV